MSILVRVREKFKTPMLGTSGSSTSPSAGSAGPSHRHPETSLSPAQETARADVLDQLAKNPAVQRCFVNRFEPDGSMIVTLGIRGVGTGELMIPAARFDQGSLDDYGALLGCMAGSA